MTWKPVLFTRNSGDARDASGRLVGGSRWYIPSETYAKQSPSFKRFGDFLGGIETLPSDRSVPWIMETRHGKVFVGEYMIQHARLNVNGESHPFARDGLRGIHCLYGFEADLGERVPSYDDMRRMSDAWRKELSHLITKLNENAGEAYTNRTYLRGFAKEMRDFMPDGEQIGAHYGDNLWDQRAKLVNEGKALDRPLLVNAVEFQNKHFWADFGHMVEVDGAAQKKTASEMGSKVGGIAKSLSTSARRSSTLDATASTGLRKDLRPSVAFMAVSGVILGGAIGLWAFRHLQQKRKQDAQSTSPAIGR